MVAPERGASDSLAAAAAYQDNSLLAVTDLAVTFGRPGRQVHAVRSATFAVHRREIVGLVGESGSGKSVTLSAILRLNPSPCRVSARRLEFDGTDLRSASERALQSIRGGKIGMIFQDPMSSFNPVRTVGQQLLETYRLHHRDASRQEARDRAIQSLVAAGFPAPASRLGDYPHQLSGGMLQRAMIAMALINDPSLVLADEPTTALDVTIQSEILRLLLTLREETDASVVLVTHNVGVIAEVADSVVVMYAGRVVESGPVHEMFDNPCHPYMVLLRACLPHIERSTSRLPVISGQMPAASELSTGCVFASRCPMVQELCRVQAPELAEVRPGHYSACHFADRVADSPDMTNGLHS